MARSFLQQVQGGVQTAAGVAGGLRTAYQIGNGDLWACAGGRPVRARVMVKALRRTVHTVGERKALGLRTIGHHVERRLERGLRTAATVAQRMDELQPVYHSKARRCCTRAA